ncbi:FliM/FliN family flagellar motor switch protein [Alkalilacustris brevis]|uniref:FliM/FliN family flagellar motor switch protein n=1 Tax=Alkalilacustris brevis TaxID=2026338 RepID=UPI000E0DF636|nr:FliM/FliN family flagellar motor C-terminal domain-containing protein [Alkalilacustris brevis]
MAQMARTDSVLRRKAGRREQGEAEAQASLAQGAHTVPRALRRALARAGQNEIGLLLTVDDITEHAELSLAELLDLPEAGALLAVLEGPGDDLGLMAWSPQLVEGVVQQQTTGAVHPVLAQPRRPTRTDAAMSAGLVDRSMREFERLLSRGEELGWAGGYRYASFLEEPRTLGLLLEDIAYRSFVIEVTLGEGQRSGKVLLALPRSRQGAAGRPAAIGDSGHPAAGAGAGDAPGDPARDWQAAMEQVVMASPARLCAVLARPRVALSRVINWRPGDVFALPLARIDRVSLHAAGGRQVALGRLGQSRGFRALRLGDLAQGGEGGLPGGGAREVAPAQVAAEPGAMSGSCATHVADPLGVPAQAPLPAGGIAAGIAPADTAAAPSAAVPSGGDGPAASVPRLAPLPAGEG